MCSKKTPFFSHTTCSNKKEAQDSTATTKTSNYLSRVNHPHQLIGLPPVHILHTGVGFSSLTGHHILPILKPWLGLLPMWCLCIGGALLQF